VRVLAIPSNVILLSLFTLIIQAVAATEMPLTLDFTTLLVPIDVATRNARAIELPLYNGIKQQKLYLVNITVGTPPQPFSILLNTGSTDVWLPTPNSSGCPSTGCPFNNFDMTAASTYVPTNNTFNASYGLTPDLVVIGPYFRDHLRLGVSVWIPNMTIATDEIPSTIYIEGFQASWGYELVYERLS
jgi:hypothetical protein